MCSFLFVFVFVFVFVFAVNESAPTCRVCVEALKLGANRIVSARYMRIVIGICIDIDCCTVRNEVIPATGWLAGWLANTLTG